MPRRHPDPPATKEDPSNRHTKEQQNRISSSRSGASRHPSGRARRGVTSCLCDRLRPRGSSARRAAAGPRTPALSLTDPHGRRTASWRVGTTTGVLTGDTFADGARQELEEANGCPPPNTPVESVGEDPSAGNNRCRQVNLDPPTHPAPNLLPRKADPRGGRADPRRGWTDLRRAGP
jgi:hypothetical protein